VWSSSSRPCCASITAPLSRGPTATGGRQVSVAGGRRDVLLRAHAVHYAAFHNNRELITLLIEVHLALLDSAARTDDGVQNFIAVDIPTFPVGAHDKGRTPLHLAAMRGGTTLPVRLHSTLSAGGHAGHWAVVMALLDERMDVEVIDKDGCTALALVSRARPAQQARARPVP
jgi:ankyrin repeat protein